jgi:hypothetical protein
MPYLALHLPRSWNYMMDGKTVSPVLPSGSFPYSPPALSRNMTTIKRPIAKSPNEILCCSIISPPVKKL